jgi:hypothetical protein
LWRDFALSKYICAFNEEGELVQVFDLNHEEWCSGICTGEVGAMCGGCDGCGLAQAEFAGLELREGTEDEMADFYS